MSPNPPHSTLPAPNLVMIDIEEALANHLDALTSGTVIPLAQIPPGAAVEVHACHLFITMPLPRDRSTNL